MIKKRDATLAIVFSLVFHSAVFALSAFEMSSPEKVLPVKPLEISLLKIDEQAKVLEVPKPKEVVQPPEKPKKVVKKKPVKKLVKKKTVVKKVIQKKEVVQEADSTEEAVEEVAPPQGNSAEAKKVRADYRQIVAGMLAKAKRYPRMARRRGQEGEGVLELWITANGELTNANVRKSAKYSLLDKEMKRMAERAAPFPPFPENMREARLHLVVPIHFELN